MSHGTRALLWCCAEPKSAELVTALYYTMHDNRSELSQDMRTACEQHATT